MSDRGGRPGHPSPPAADGWPTREKHWPDSTWVAKETQAASRAKRLAFLPCLPPALAQLGSGRDEGSKSSWFLPALELQSRNVRRHGYGLYLQLVSRPVYILRVARELPEARVIAFTIRCPLRFMSLSSLLMASPVTVSLSSVVASPTK